MKNKTENPLASALAKGQRLKRVRNLANLSREQLCEDSKVNIHTLIGWECGRFGGLTLLGAQRIIKRLEREGVFCTPAWLVHEIGPAPIVNTDYPKTKPENASITKNKKTINSNDATIVQELLFFKNLHKHAIDYKIEDDSMLPQYNSGDYVAGIKRYKKNIDDVTGLDCILQTKDGKTLLRNLRNGSQADSYTLVSSNPHTSAKDTILYNIELISAAPIIWHRKKDNY